MSTISSILITFFKSMHMPCSHTTDSRPRTCQFTMTLSNFLSQKNMNNLELPMYPNERSINIYRSLFCVFTGRRIVEAVYAGSHIQKTLTRILTYYFLFLFFYPAYCVYFKSTSVFDYFSHHFSYRKLLHFRTAFKQQILRVASTQVKTAPRFVRARELTLNKHFDL